MKLLNVTQHIPTEDMPEVVVSEGLQPKIVWALTFNDLPTKEEMLDRANALVSIYKGVASDRILDGALLGGAPFFMPILQKAFKDEGIDVYYAFSKRVSVEVHNPDGTVSKQNVFKCLGYYKA